ncbi:MAG: SHOCT domain-containing protein [Paraclostridium sp.]
MYRIQVSEIKKSSVDRSKYILNKIGCIDNVDINLSKYSNKNQLIVLKDKTIYIGHNNFETEKIIDFNSIIKFEFRVNNAKLGTSYQYAENTNKDIIESIIVYIHTHDFTEELDFKYSAYELKKAQENYNEILKGLKRLKVMLYNTSDSDYFDKTTNLNINEKSIPEQIKEYKELLDINAITKEEFEMKKKELLNK